MVFRRRSAVDARMRGKSRFGLTLAAIRRRRGLTQEDLAALIGRTPAALSKLERGGSYPQMETLIRLSATLAIPLRDLIDELDPNPPTDPRRITLEATLLDTARTLDQRDLEIAVDQVQAFARYPIMEG